MIISIIIPVYNVEKYLRQCLDSCLNQDIPKSEYEIIIVNDGSPDNSQIIIDEYASKNANIKVIKKENGGLSSARNAGLEIASGDYIWFVDSDDSIKENCLNYICSLFKNNQIQLMTFDYDCFDDNNVAIKTQSRNLVNSKIYSGVELYKNGWIYPFSAVQFYIFQKTYLDRYHLFFKQGIYGEDWLFTISSYMRFEKCMYTSQKLYNYYLHKGSITHNGYSLKKGNDCITICKELYSLLDDSKVKDYIVFNSIAQTIKPIYEHWINVHKDEAKLLKNSFLKCNFWYKAIFKSLNFKYLLLLLLIKLNIRFKI